MNKPLRRIKNHESSLGGVCQGLGAYFDVDPVLFRIAFVVLIFTPFPIITLYLISWFVVPEVTYDAYYQEQVPLNNFSNSNFTTMNKSNNNGNVVGGLILIVLGSIFAFKSFFSINLFQYIGDMWPLFLIGLGVWLIIRPDRKKDLPNEVSSTNTEVSEDNF